MGKTLIQAAAPELVTIPNVEIVSTGTYDLASPGQYTFTTEDLAAAVEAQDDPMVRSPRLKLGHTSEFGDAEPAFGKVLNMRLTNEGHTIVGDYVGVPKWLAAVMPVAYPSRSLEGGPLDNTASNGKKYSMVISAVSLLGVVMPGVSSIEDLPELFGEEEPDGVEIVATINAKVGGGSPMPPITATVEVEDIRREYYDSLNADQMFWWIRAVELDPNALIVDDDDGHLFRIPFTISGEDITFGDPAEVQIVYTPVDESVNAAVRIAAGSGRMDTVFANRSESRPESTDEEESVDGKELRASLGLAEDASDKEVKAKLEELKAASEESEDKPTEENDDEETDDEDSEGEDSDEDSDDEDAEVEAGTTTIDKATLAELRAGAEDGRKARARQQKKDREDLLTAAVKAGKFAPSRKDHWRKLYKEDPEGTKATIESLEPGLIPVDEGGGSPDSEIEAGAGYDRSWLSPQERARIDAAAEGSANGRVTTAEVS